VCKCAVCVVRSSKFQSPLSSPQHFFAHTTTNPPFSEFTSQMGRLVGGGSFCLSCARRVLWWSFRHRGKTSPSVRVDILRRETASCRRSEPCHPSRSSLTNSVFIIIIINVCVSGRETATEMTIRPDCTITYMPLLRKIRSMMIHTYPPHHLRIGNGRLHT
jgi:hypothetical protein